MTVTDGMDVERVRSIAQQLLSQSTKIDDVRSSGEGQIGVLEGAWSGPDLKKFEDGWDSAMPQLDHAGQALRNFGRELARQANDQEKASDGVGGRTGVPVVPPGKSGEGQSLLDRIVKGIGNALKGLWDAFSGAVDWVKDNIWTPLGIPLILKDIVEGLRKVADDFKKWTDDLVAKAGKWFDETFPKLLKWGEKLAPVGKFLAKFGKVFGKIIPGAGVFFWAWDMKDLVVDLWNGEVNPAELWNKGVLGTASMIAGFVPGWGTLISAAIAVEQLRHEYMPKMDGWIADKLGVPTEFVTGGRVALMSAMNPVMAPFYMADLLPNENFDLPGPSPKELWDNGVDAVKDAGDTLANLNPLPWP
ncbi:WXG100 family type VII secretion target [Janibacter indicus]|uniref:WXG100 family type VII secretion target n=1 Tax=Janibacter indicus TaxID=857417 RepID=UPI003D9A1701